MARDIIFNQQIQELIKESADIFGFEYPAISEKKWQEFKNNPNCKCNAEIYAEIQKDVEKMNSIFSTLMGEEVNIIFPGPLPEAIVQEFENIKDMENFIKELQKKGKMIRSASPSPNGKGGFILIVM